MTKKQPTYQELKQSLDAILAKLQREDVDVDEAITLHAEGQKILKQLDTYLNDVAEKTEQA